MPSSTRRPDGPRGRAGLSFATVALVAAGLWPGVEARAGSLAVTWRGGLLGIAAADVPRVEVLREVARLTGTRLLGLEALVDRVSLQLVDADLGSALRQLAGDGSYALVETPPRRKGGTTRYEIFFAPRGGTPQPDVMRGQPAVSVLVEDPDSHEMRPQVLPAAPVGYPRTVRPDEQPVSVQVNPG